MVHIKQLNEHKAHSSIFASFSATLQIMIVATIFILTCILSTTWHFEVEMLSDGSLLHKFKDTWHYVFGIFCLQSKYYFTSTISICYISENE